MKLVSGNQAIRWQMSLRRLLVVVALCGCGLGLLGRHVLLRERYVGFGGLVVNMDSHWKAQLGKPELLYMVVYPKGVYGHKSMAAGRGHTPETEGVCILPEGVYIDGTRIECNCRVFVLSAEGELIPIQLSPQELESIIPEPGTDISQTAAWPKIKVIYEAEAKAALQKERNVIRVSN